MCNQVGLVYDHNNNLLEKKFYNASRKISANYWYHLFLKKVLYTKKQKKNCFTNCTKLYSNKNTCVQAASRRDVLMLL